MDPCACCLRAFIFGGVFGGILITTNRATYPGDTFFRRLTILFALALFLLVLVMAFQLYREAQPSLQRFGWPFVWGREWDPVHEKFGALPYIYGTLVSTLLALALAGPISLGAAVYLAEFAPRRLKATLAFLVDLLAGIPGIVYGLWGSFVLAPFLRNCLEPWLGKYLGFLPLFQGPPFGIGLLAAGIILAIMCIPVMTAVTREVLEVVPAGQREALLAFGATPWEVVRLAVLPYAREGIIGAFFLGLGKALGETLAVTMVIGNRPEISLSLFSPAHSMTSVIVNEFAQAVQAIHLAALIHIGLLLFGITLLVNIIARLLIYRLGRKVSRWKQVEWK